MTKVDFWEDIEAAQKTTQLLNNLKEEYTYFTSLGKRIDDARVFAELIKDENNKDDELLSELSQNINDLEKEINELKLKTMLSGKYDSHNAIISLHPGAGGTESQDWAQMLMRMYLRWAERKGFKTEILDYLPGDEAGIKSVTIEVSGHNAYGYLKSEKGVHRLVRISPFDASGRRHTSFASVDVMPEIDNDTEIIINPNDLRIETFRAGGAGGQHVNKTDSAVRIVHIPTGIVATCQNERSQHSNRLAAMKILKAKLFERYQMEQEQKVNELRGEYREIAWGNQIRSYVFHPYTLVKDHRTNVEVGNVNAVMDGDLDIFINAYLMQQHA